MNDPSAVKAQLRLPVNFRRVEMLQDQRPELFLHFPGRSASGKVLPFHRVLAPVIKLLAAVLTLRQQRTRGQGPRRLDDHDVLGLRRLQAQLARGDGLDALQVLERGLLQAQLAVLLQQALLLVLQCLAARAPGQGNVDAVTGDAG